jgi:hypothetical protein
LPSKVLNGNLEYHSHASLGDLRMAGKVQSA